MEFNLGMHATKIFSEKPSVMQVKERLETHKIWREKDDIGELAVFSKVTFDDVDLSGFVFSETIFCKVHFEKTKFIGATFENAKFIGCTFHNVDMSEANLSCAKIIDSFIMSTKFKKANLESVDFLSTTC